MLHFLTRVFGSRNERLVRGYGRYVRAANEFEPTIQALSDEGLRAKTDEFRKRLAEGTKLVDESGQVLAEIVIGVKKVTDVMAEIASSSREQAAGIEQVNKAITLMDDVTQQNAALVEEASAAAQEAAKWFPGTVQRANAPHRTYRGMRGARNTT